MHYANELLVRVRLSFQKLLQNRSTCRNNTKCLEKSNDAYSFSISVQTTINHILIFTFLCFIRQYQRQRKCFLSERELKKTLRDTLTRAAWFGFDWFVLSMGMQVSCFARPGSAPIWESSGTGLTPIENLRDRLPRMYEYALTLSTASIS